jgi:hypothetical protein
MTGSPDTITLEFSREMLDEFIALLNKNEVIVDTEFGPPRRLSFSYTEFRPGKATLEVTMTDLEG